MNHEEHLIRAFDKDFLSKWIGLYEASPAMKDLEDDLYGEYINGSPVDEVIWYLEFCTDAGLLMDRDAVY